MADDLDAELEALEDSAPLTEEIDEGAGADEVVASDEGEPIEGKPKQTYLTPEEYEARHENTNKALRAERERARAIERQYAEAVQQQRQMEAAFQEMQARQRLAALQQQAPDPWQDPEGAQRHQEQLRQLAIQQQQQQYAVQQQAFQARQAAEVEQRVLTNLETHEEEFKSQHADYDEAVDHLLNVQEAMLINAGHSPEAARQAVNNWAFENSRHALSQGRNPAEVAYKTALAAGFQAKKLDASAQAAAQKLGAIRAGQGSAKTLSGGGTPQSGGVSLKQIASLQGAAFDKALDKFLRG